MMLASLLLLSPLSYIDSYVVGGWSDHQIDSDYEYNQVHNMLGVKLNNNLKFTTFENSLGKRSFSGSVEVPVKDFKYVSLYVDVGVATGYDTFLRGYAMPAVSIGYGSYWIDVGRLQKFDGHVDTLSLRYKF